MPYCFLLCEFATPVFSLCWRLAEAAVGFVYRNNTDASGMCVFLDLGLLNLEMRKLWVSGIHTPSKQYGI